MQVLAESEQVDRFVAEDPLVEIVARDADEEHADRAGAQEDARRDVDVERTALVGRGGRQGSSRDVTGGDVADDRAELEGAKDCVEPYVEDLQDGSEEGDPVEHDVPVVNGHLRLKTILDGGSSPHSSLPSGPEPAKRFVLSALRSPRHALLTKQRRVRVHRHAKLAVGVAEPQLEKDALGHENHQADLDCDEHRAPHEKMFLGPGRESRVDGVVDCKHLVGARAGSLELGLKLWIWTWAVAEVWGVNAGLRLGLVDQMGVAWGVDDTGPARS